MEMSYYLISQEWDGTSFVLKTIYKQAITSDLNFPLTILWTNAMFTNFIDEVFTSVQPLFVMFASMRLFGYPVETFKCAFGVVKHSLTTNSLVWLAFM